MLKRGQLIILNVGICLQQGTTSCLHAMDMLSRRQYIILNVGIRLQEAAYHKYMDWILLQGEYIGFPVCVYQKNIFLKDLSNKIKNPNGTH